MPGTVELAKRTLRLPAQVGYPKPLGGILDQVDSPVFATVIGLVLLAEESIMDGKGGFRGGAFRWEAPEWARQTTEKVQKFAKRFLP